MGGGSVIVRTASLQACTVSKISRIREGGREGRRGMIGVTPEAGQVPDVRHGERLL